MQKWIEQNTPPINNQPWLFSIEGDLFGVRWQYQDGLVYQKIVSHNHIMPLTGCPPNKNNMEQLQLIAFILIEDDSPAELIGASKNTGKQ